MKNIINKIIVLFNSEAIRYIITRYATYFIQFINSLFIASFLGPYYLGIWGFIQMIISYFSQINFGIPNSVNNILAIYKQDNEYCKKIAGNGLTMLIYLSVLIIIFFIINFRFNLFNIGEKYNFDEYTLYVCIIAIFGHFNSYYSNIFRIYGKLREIIIYQSLYPFLVLFILFFFKEKQLLIAMLIANSISLIIPFVIFIINSPIKVRPKLDWNIIKRIQKKGGFLFIYTISYSFILLSTRTFISQFYSVEEFGLFTFSFSLANAVLLLMNAISYLISPKMLNRFAISDKRHVNNILENLRSVYISTSHMLMHFIIMVFPILLNFFPEYSDSLSVFILTGLTLVVYTNSFGYQYIISAKEKDKELAYICFSILLLNIFLLFLFINIINVTFEYAILATMISYFSYVLIVGIYGQMALNTYKNVFTTFKEIFPLRMMIPFFISLLFIFISAKSFCYIIPFVLYVILNFKDTTKVKYVIIKMIRNPNFVNI